MNLLPVETVVFETSAIQMFLVLSYDILKDVYRFGHTWV